MSDPRQPFKTQHEEPFNAGDAQSVKRQEVIAKEMKLRRLAGLKKILEDVDSRLWLAELLQFCGVHRISFTGNSETFYREGHRNVGLKIQKELTSYYPDSYVLMLRENEQELAVQLARSKKQGVN